MLSLKEIQPLFTKILEEYSDLEVCLFFNDESLKKYSLQLWIIQFTLKEFLPKELTKILDRYGFDFTEQEEPYR